MKHLTEQTPGQLLEATRRDAELFMSVPIVSPKIETWGGVPGALLLRSNPERLPDCDAFKAVAQAGILFPMPKACPVVEAADRPFSEAELEAMKAWGVEVREWRAKIHPSKLARSFLLVGEPGTGKTRAAIARAQAWSLAAGVFADGTWRSQGVRSRFVRGCDLAVASVAEARGEPHGLGSGIQSVASLERLAFLVIDDFDAANWSPVSLAAFYTILDTRLSTGAPTIITANGNAGGWAERVVARHPNEGEMAKKILRRIRDLCGAPVRFNLNAKKDNEHAS